MVKCGNYGLINMKKMNNRWTDGKKSIHDTKYYLLLHTFVQKNGRALAVCTVCVCLKNVVCFSWLCHKSLYTSLKRLDRVLSRPAAAFFWLQTCDKNTTITVLDQPNRKRGGGTQSWTWPSGDIFNHNFYASNRRNPCRFLWNRFPGFFPCSKKPVKI